MAHVFNIIESAATSTARYYQEKHISKKHAINNVISTCENYGDRALKESWNLKDYGRPKALQESALWSYLHYHVLDLGTDGLLKKPDLALIPIMAG